MTQALRISDPSSRPWLPLPFSLLLALSLMALFAGCAQNPGAGSNTGAGVGRTAEPVTESDEPEARKRARIRLELAAGYFEQGQTTVALDEIKLSLAADPTYASAYMLRGLVYSRMNELPLAEESFRRAQQLNPRDPDVLHHYGLFACQQGRYAQAVELFQQAMASPVYGGQAKTLMAKGVCQVRAGQFAEAEGSLARSYESRRWQPHHRLQPGRAAVSAWRKRESAVHDPSSEQFGSGQRRDALAWHQGRAQGGQHRSHAPARPTAGPPLP